MQKVVLIIPKFNDVVAPCFEVASTFIIVTIENGLKSAMSIEHCHDCEGIGRVRFVQDHHGDVVICNGIKAFYKDILIDSGIKVINDVGLNIEQVIDKYIQGSFKYESSSDEFINVPVQLPIDDIICWTKDFFKTHGYEVHKGENRAPFPIDLVAELKCPVCGKPIRVAICCGSHSYRPDQELREFHRASAIDYHARVYVHPFSSDLKQQCMEYGIELIDPFEDIEELKSEHKRGLPILKGAVLGHERI